MHFREGRRQQEQQPELKQLQRQDYMTHNNFVYARILFIIITKKFLLTKDN